jgi:hypothetical protein
MTEFRNIVSLVSIGRTDIRLVYRNQIESRIKKLKPNPSRSAITSAGLEGGLASSDTAPIERASPNIMSERVWILGRGTFSLATTGT